MNAPRRITKKTSLTDLPTDVLQAELRRREENATAAGLMASIGIAVERDEGRSRKLAVEATPDQWRALLEVYGP